jgi:predicted NBD/HSP70 family sugar kinase/predicted transcriptional regulator
MPEIGKPKTIRRTNMKVILNLLRSSGEMSVAEISKNSKLSKTTVMKILNYYTKKGQVVKTGKGSSTDEGGKKPNLFKFNEKCGYVVAFHIFPDELFCVLTDLRSAILQRISLPLKSGEGGELIVDGMAESYRSLIQREGLNYKNVIGVVIGAHGITDYGRGVILISPHFPSWGKNFKLRELISKKISSGGSIIIDNQIRFQVFAEKTMGLAKNNKNIIVIEGGVGLVAGVIVKDEIKRGAHYLAGEIGHMILNPSSDETCACGGKGCFEVMVSVDRILRIARERYDDFRDSLIFQEKGPENIDVEDIFDASNKDDRLAKDIMNDIVKWFSIGLSNLILAYDPEVIIIQGIFTKAGIYFLRGLRDTINTVSLVKMKRDVKIECSTFGKEVGVLGSSAYVVSEYFK